MSSSRWYALAAVVALCAVPVAAQSPKPLGKEDFKVGIELGHTPIVSQGRTGTCWSFATVSFLESEIERIHGEDVDLSEMHTVYWGYVEKARRFVRLHGKAQFSEGGLSHDVTEIASRHGLAPLAAYTGLVGDGQVHNHAALSKAVEAVMQPFVAGQRPAGELEAAVRAVLDEHLGAPPETFEAKGVTVTPVSYAKDLLNLPFADYVELMSLESEGFGRRAELLVPDNWMRYQGYWNVPVADLLANVDHALEKGYTIALDCDVSERTNGNGLMKLSAELEAGEISDELRQQMFDDRRTTDDHLMQIVGTAEGPDGKTWYLVKNSWGNRGPFDGYVMMSRNYLAAKTLGIMVHRDGLLPATRDTFAR
jgi:bleomycin hydrolase